MTTQTAAPAKTVMDADTLAKLARLSKLHLTADEKSVLAVELPSILGWIEQLLAMDTAGVAPMTSVLNDQLRTRADQVTVGDLSREVLAGAPQSTAGFYTIPKVVE
jgi:aspartyl-tRNA(Asn)/glutamyl-tRNA(Gln) amidotransferase subunit C